MSDGASIWRGSSRSSPRRARRGAGFSRAPGSASTCRRPTSTSAVAETPADPGETACRLASESACREPAAARPACARRRSNARLRRPGVSSRPIAPPRANSSSPCRAAARAAFRLRARGGRLADPHGRRRGAHDGARARRRGDRQLLASCGRRRLDQRRRLSGGRTWDHLFERIAGDHSTVLGLP